MESAQSSVFTRDDTFFGVCEALGEDFRINPIFLRVAFALGLFWNPLAVAGLYVACGVVVFVSRWLVPNPRVQTQPEAADESEPELELVEQAQSWEELAVAA